MRDGRSRTAAVVAALALAVALPACGGLFGGRNREPVQTYMFSPREFEQIREVDSDLILLVSPVQSVGYDHQNMSYAMRPYERTYYAFSRWADTPPRMIHPIIVQAMEASGMFGAVIDTSSSVVADLRLDVDLQVLQHEFHTDPSQGRLVIRAQINDLESNTILSTRIFQEVAPAPTENPYGGVLALNLALETILGDLVDWVSIEVRTLEQAQDEARADEAPDGG